MTFLEELLEDFQKMLEFRVAVGYATATYKSCVTPFIRFCGVNHPEEKAITQPMVDDWLVYYAYEKSQSQPPSCPASGNTPDLSTPLVKKPLSPGLIIPLNAAGIFPMSSQMQSWVSSSME